MAEAVNSEASRAPGPLEALRRRGFVVVISILLFAAGALTVSLVQDPSYEATASVLVTVDEQSELTANELIELIDTDAVTDAVARRLDGSDSESITGRIETSAGEAPGVYAIEVEGRSPERVTETATALAEELVDFARELEGFAGEVEVIERAAEPTSPSSPRTVRNTLLAALAGFLVGIVVAFAWARLDPRVRTGRELDAILGVPLLGRVPRSEALGLGAGLRELPTADAEAFQMARVSIRYLDVDREITSALITSPEAGDGKTTVAFGLAVSAATSGDRVLVIEADVRQPSLASVAEGASRTDPGLSTVLAGRAALADALVRVKVTTGGNVSGPVDVLLAGPAPPNPTRLFESEAMSRLLAEAQRDYDLVLIDSPPATILPDAVPLTRQVDGVVVVAGLGHARSDGLRELRDRLETLDAPLIGVIANFAERPDDAYFRYLRAHESAVAEAGTVSLRPARAAGGRPGAAAPTETGGREGRPEAPEPVADEPEPEGAPPETVRSPAPDGPVDLNEATFEELRALDLSITQAKRLLAYRQRSGGFGSVDQIDDVPGFPDDVLEELKRHVTV